MDNQTTSILQEIFEGYDKRVIPFTHGPVLITTSIVLGILIELKENQQLAAYVISHTQRWDDHRLKWDPERFAGQTEVIAPQSMVWIPKLFVYNSLESKEMLSDNRADVRLYHSGKVKINIPQYVEAICRIQTEAFPFDCQFCAVALASPLLNVKEMVVNATKPPVDSYFTGNAEWQLFNVTVRHLHFQEEGEERVEIHYIFHLKRKPTYYLTVIVAPTFLISALSILGIFSPGSNDGPRNEKVSLGLGSLLAMSVLLGIVAGAMPKSNSIPLLGYYILIVILLCAIAVTISMVFLSVSRYYIHREQMPSKRLFKALFMDAYRKRRSTISRGAYFPYSEDSNCCPKISHIPELNMIFQTLEEIAESHRSMRRKLEQKNHKKLVEKEWSRVFTRFDYFFLFVFEMFNLSALTIFLRVAWSAYLEVFGARQLRIGSHLLVPSHVDASSFLDNANRLHLLESTICKHLLNSSIATVVFAPSAIPYPSDFHSLVASVAYSIGFYRLPVLGVQVRDAEFSKKHIYPSFIRVTTSYADQAFVFLHLLQRLSYRQVVVLSIHGDLNGRRFVTEFERRRNDYGVHVQQYIDIDRHNVSMLSPDFEIVTSNIVILYANSEMAENIFSELKNKTMTKVWIINEEASTAANLPKGALTCRLTQSSTAVLRDSFLLLKSSLTSMLSNISAPLQLPVNCSKQTQTAFKDWTALMQNYHNRICSTRTTDIIFNDYCERIAVNYEILNMNERLKSVGSLRGAHLSLEENAIVWASGSKPFEISLPKHLRAVTVHDPPFIYATLVMGELECQNLGKVDVKLSGRDSILVPGPWYYCPKSLNNKIEHYCCAGYAIDLLSNISLSDPNSSIDRSFNFSLHLNESYGAVVAANDARDFSLSGALWELDNDFADLAIGGMSINPEREHYVDFSEPWLYHGIRILEKSQSTTVSTMQSFLQPLQSSLWTALFVSVVVIGLAIYLLDFSSPFHRFYSESEKSNDPFGETDFDTQVDYAEANWFVWGVLLNSGVSEKTPRSCAARVLGLVWCGFCMIIVASYTANLAAFLVLDQPEKGLSGITDPRLRNPSVNFSFATVINSNVYQYFKRHVELSTMFRKMEKDNVWKAEDAIDALLNGTLDAFIWDSSRLDFEAARHCQLRTRGALFGRSAYAIALQKNSPWTQHITAAVLRMSESGLMDDLNEKWIAVKRAPCEEIQQQKSPARLGLFNMKDLFILMTTGVLFGVILSLFEISYGRRKAERGRRRKIALKYTKVWRKKIGSYSISGTKRYYLTSTVLKRGMIGLDRMPLEWPSENVPFRPNLDFHDTPVILFCSRCRNLVQTDVHKETGSFACLVSCLLALLCLCPLSPLPCYLNTCSDFLHICPFCAHTIGRHRPRRKPRFYP